MTLVSVQCAYCKQRVDKDLREYNRSTRLGRPLYCNLVCAARVSNEARRARQVERICPCGRAFTSTTRKRARTHCSRECAGHFVQQHLGEVGKEAQRQGGLAQTANLISPAAALKKREAWRYAALHEVLHGRPYEFEYALEEYVFDLALLDTRTLVEFDGRYHDKASQQEADTRKEAVASKHGFTVVRRKTREAAVFHPDILKAL